MSDTKKDEKPDCFGLLYEESACSDCSLASECDAECNADPEPAIKVDSEDEDLELAAAKALAEEETAKAEVDEPATDVKPDTPKPKKKAAPAKPKKKKPPVKKSSAALVNRAPFKELMDGGKIAPLVDEAKKKTYMQVDDGGIHIYKSQIYHEKNLSAFAKTGENPFKNGSVPAEAFNFLKGGEEVTFRDAVDHLVTVFPGKNETTLMNRAADVLSGAHFFGIAKVTKKVGRQKFFQMQ